MTSKAILGPFKGEKHPPRYRFHKYWARKPFNVVRDHIAHYTKENDVVLDPFCGSGVSVIEATLMGRQGIGIDINPIATALPMALVSDYSRDDIVRAFNTVRENVESYIHKRFSVACPDCGKKSVVRYRVCVSVATCPDCGTKNTLKKTGTRNNKSRCSQCNTRLFSLMVTEDIVEKVSIDCTSCKFRNRLFPFSAKKALSKSGRAFISNKRIMSYSDKKTGWLFTDETWKCLKKIEKSIQSLEPSLELIFRTLLSSTATQVSRMIPYRENLSTGGPAWTVPGFWVPPVHIQFNVWRTFRSRFRRYLSAIDDMKSFGTFQRMSRPSISTADASIIAMADNSVDYVITDPPYGDSVPYLEFSQIWNEWLDRKPFYKKEIVISNSTVRKKDIADYSSRLNRVFREIGRVLKNGKWATVFFQNRHLSVWNVLRKAAIHGGLLLKSVSLHYPAVVSAKAQLAREGSLTGDLVLQFQKTEHMETVPQVDCISRLITEAVGKHAGTKNAFDRIVSDVLVNMWTSTSEFSTGDLGKRILEAISQSKSQESV